MRHRIAPVALATLTVCALAGVAGPAASAVPVRPAAAVSASASPDFDGDGKADLAWVGSPGTDDFPLHVHYGSGTDQTISIPGYTLSSITAGDLNADGRTDLAYVSYFSMGPASITVLFGSADGLDPATKQTIPTSDADSGYDGLTILSSPTPRVAAGDFSEDSAGGAVSFFALDSTGRFALDSDGLAVPDVPGINPGNDGIPKLPGYNGFGSTLAHSGDLLVVGAPGARVAGKSGAGAIVAAHLGAAGVDATQFLTRNSRGVAGTPAKNAGFGATIAAADGYVAVGLPGEKVNGASSAGAVLVFRVSGDKLVPVSRISQASSGVPGTAERGDRFGAAVAVGQVCAGVTGVVVGAPGEKLVSKHKADGAAWLIPLTRSKSCLARMLYEGHGLAGRPVSGRALGAQVGVLRDAGATTSTIVVGGAGLIAAWSPATRTTLYSAADGVTTIVD